MNKNKFLLITLVGFLFSILTFFYMNVDTYADVSGVTITPLIEDDSSGVTDRFQIVGKSKSERHLKLSFSNFSINRYRLVIEPRNATTSMDGQLVYQDKVKAGQYGLKYAFSDMTSTKEINIGPNKTKDVEFTVKLPSSEIKGLVMGGFYVYVKGDRSKGSADVPVWITTNNKSVGGILSLNNLALDVIGKKPHIIVNLQNKEPGAMKKVIVHMTVKRKSWLDRFNLGPKKMIADLTYPNVAPNSRIPVDFDQNTTPISAGKYVVKGAARSGKATWTFQHTYTVTQDQANNINKRCKGLIYNKTTTYILIVCVLVSLIFLIFWAIWYSGRS